MKKYEKLYPQLVEVVNELKATIASSQTSPVLTKPVDSLLANAGTGIKVIDTGTHQSEVYVRPTNLFKNLYINAVHVINSGIGYFVPYSLVVYDTSPENIQGIVASVYNQLHDEYPTSDIKVFYCVCDNSRTYNFYCYSGS